MFIHLQLEFSRLFKTNRRYSIELLRRFIHININAKFLWNLANTIKGQQLVHSGQNQFFSFCKSYRINRRKQKSKMNYVSIFFFFNFLFHFLFLCLFKRQLWTINKVNNRRWLQQHWNTPKFLTEKKNMIKKKTKRNYSPYSFRCWRQGLYVWIFFFLFEMLNMRRFIASTSEDS